MAHGDLFTVTEAAERLGVSTAWIYQRVQSGELPAVRLSDGPRSPIRFRAEDLDAWIAARKATA